MAGGDGRCEAYVHRITKADAAGERCVRAPAQGLTTVAMKLAIVKLLDYNFVAEAMFRFGSYSGDWKQFNATRRKRPHSQ